VLDVAVWLPVSVVVVWLPVVDAAFWFPSVGELRAVVCVCGVVVVPLGAGCGWAVVVAPGWEMAAA